MMANAKRARLLAALAGTILALAPAGAAERQIDPTFLYRDSNKVPEKPSDITTPSCRYKPLLGAGAQETPVLGTVARYGIVEIDPKCPCKPVRNADEEQLYVVLKGAGEAQYG